MGTATHLARARTLLSDLLHSGRFYAVIAPPWTWVGTEPHLEQAVARLWVWNDTRRALVTKYTAVDTADGPRLETRECYLPLDRLVAAAGN